MLRAILTTAAVACVATAAHAASSDYYLKLEGVEGEARVEGWSFGACNAGCMSNGSTKREAAAPKRLTGPLQTSQNSQSLRESPTLSRAPRVAVGDVDGDGVPDLAYAATMPEVEGLTVQLDKSSPQLAKICEGKHIAKAELRTAADTFEITGASATCGSSPASRLNTGTMPNRISMNVTVPKQTQGATFGERCAAGTCAADATVYVTLTGGQMKHTKTGHVTILK